MFNAFFNQNDNFKVPIETVVEDVMHYYRFDNEDRFLSYMFAKAKKDYLRFCANVIYVEVESEDFLIHVLMEELSKSYEAVRNIQPDTSMY